MIRVLALESAHLVLEIQLTSMKKPNRGINYFSLLQWSSYVPWLFCFNWFPPIKGHEFIKLKFDEPTIPSTLTNP